MGPVGPGPTVRLTRSSGSKSSTRTLALPHTSSSSMTQRVKARTSASGGICVGPGALGHPHRPLGPPPEDTQVPHVAPLEWHRDTWVDPNPESPHPKVPTPNALGPPGSPQKGHPGPYQVPKDEEADGAAGVEGERLEDINGRPPIRTQVLGGEKGGHHGGLGSAWGDMGLPRGLLG